MKRKITLEIEAPSNFGMKFLTDSLVTCALALNTVRKTYHCTIIEVDPKIGEMECDDDFAGRAEDNSGRDN